MQPLPRSFFEQDAVAVARALLGKVVKRVGDPELGEGGVCAGIIVEAEAYGGDAASHAVKKPVQGRLMRETYGYWYVYFTYGMHWCANVTCDKAGAGAVLIRAVEPTAGIAAMKQRRGTSDVRALSSGPAKFCQAFGIGKSDNGTPLSQTFGIFEPDRNTTIYRSISARDIAATPRIGIRADTELLWRFSIKGNPFVSGPRKRS